MTSDKARKAAVRGRMATTGEPYSVAARAVREQSTTTATIDPALLVPYPDETGVTPAELGWRVLPADATPEQRAQAEAHWRPVAATRPCRCSGSCLHGTACGTDDDGGQDRCPGLLTHWDRYPGGMFAVEIWEDVHQCAACGQTMTTTVELPAVPWGEASPSSSGGVVVYDNVRHPNFDDGADDGYDSGCDECGAQAGYRCTCDEETGCPECGAGSRGGDPYQECMCYSE